MAFERFTEDARAVVVAARDEARTAGQATGWYAQIIDAEPDLEAVVAGASRASRPVILRVIRPSET